MTWGIGVPQLPRHLLTDVPLHDGCVMVTQWFHEGYATVTRHLLIRGAAPGGESAEEVDPLVGFLWLQQPRHQVSLVLCAYHLARRVVGEEKKLTCCMVVTRRLRVRRGRSPVTWRLHGGYV